jgi:hypothetical protein
MRKSAADHRHAAAAPPCANTDDPTVIAGAVEEPLRYLTIVHFRVMLA